MNSTANATGPGRRSRPALLRALVASRIGVLATQFDPLTRGWLWLPASLATGAVPVLLLLGLRSSGHQLVTAMLLTVLCLPLVWRDAWWQGLATISIVFVSHSVIAILVSMCYPTESLTMFPGGDQYWQRQYEWITTGIDPEYQVRNWIPAHFLLLLGATLFSVSSFGFMTFYHGLHEVDLMNYYNGQLILHSHGAGTALFWGWHIWSILRGVGYTVLSYELIGCSVWIFARRSVTSWTTHGWRFALGLTLLVLDGLAKYFLMEVVRSQLASNLA